MCKIRQSLFRMLWILLQISWCLPQNCIGAFLWLLHRNQTKKAFRFRGALVMPWKFRGCTSLGHFIFMEERSLHHQPLLVHEYGHTVQSAVLGWLYLPVIVLPSVLWFNLPVMQKFRKVHQYSYYRFYTEAWANRWGEKICHAPAAK